MARAFDGERQFALMSRAGADLAARANLAAIRQIAAHLVGILVINDFVLVFAIDTYATLGRSKAPLSVTTGLSPVSATVRARTARTPGPAAARSGTAA